MIRQRLVGCVLALLFIFITTPTYAEMPSLDLAGAQDHPLVSRYQGSIIVAYHSAFDEEIKLVGGTVGWGRDASKNNVMKLDNSLNIEGNSTEIIYNYPPNRAALDVIRSYQSTLQKNGFSLQYTCVKGACGALPVYFLNKIDQLFSLTGTNDFYREPFNRGGAEGYYLLAKNITAQNGVVFVAVYVVPPKAKYNGGIYVQVVEPSPLESDKNTIPESSVSPPLEPTMIPTFMTAQQMTDTLAHDGKVVLSGLYFDGEKNNLTPDSEPTLAEMAKVLQNDTKLNVYIVVHTDNKGNYAHNMDVSQKRAENVANALSSRYKIDGSRLWAKGVASLVPISTNDTDEGRNKNRRVEMVKQ